MKYRLLILSVLFFILTGCSKETNAQQPKLRDSVLVNSEIFTILYSEKFEQPLWIKYEVKCPNGTASRTGMNFYTNDSIHTSDDADYVNNVYDKGHLAPAAAFNCTRDMLYKTFTYLNCMLQHESLNRGVWSRLESYERELANLYNVHVYIRIEFSTLTLRTGARVPLGFHKEIRYNGKTECYYFRNEKPVSTSIANYKCK